MSESADFRTRLDRLDQMISGIAHQLALVENRKRSMHIRPPYKETFNSAEEPTATYLRHLLDFEASQEEWERSAGIGGV